MKLFGAIINIHQKEIIQQEILKEIISVKSLLIRNDQILQLAHRYLPYHIGVFARSL